LIPLFFAGQTNDTFRSAALTPAIGQSEHLGKPPQFLCRERIHLNAFKIIFFMEILLQKDTDLPPARKQTVNAGCRPGGVVNSPIF